MIQSFKLPFVFDIERLQNDLDQVLQSNWIAHFNTTNYTGNWSGLALRAPGGDASSIYPDPSATKEYSYTPLLQSCEYTQTVIESFHCPMLSVRFLRMEPGTVIKPHRDHTLSFEDGEVRLHIPVRTNELVEFISEGERLAMKEGECWYVNASLTHSVANRGTQDRIHLVIDCKVNNWLRTFFPIITEAQNTGMKPIRTEADKENMINALRELNTPAALEIIRQLQDTNG
jgi:mannose-6-phosphate isomerase-like protein (cupin superfamily)